MEIIVDEIPKYYDIMYIDTDNNKSAQKTYGVIRKDDKVIITEVIKIYTTEQLLAINSEKEPSELEYLKTYILMNDIKFKVSDFEIDYWEPIGEIEIVDGQFEGNNKEIHVTYVDSDNEEYTIVYNKENNYSEIEYEFTIKTFVVDKDERTSADDLTKIFDITYENDIKEIGKTILVKRGAPNFKKVLAEIDSISFKPSNGAVIKVENPAKINPFVELLIEYNYINLKVQVVDVTNEQVVLTDRSTVKINDRVLTKDELKNGILVIAGLKLTYTAECNTYIAKAEKYTPNGDEPQILTIKLQPNIVRFEIIPTVNGEEVTGATIKINNVDRKYIDIHEGTRVSYSVGKKCYITQTGEATASSEPLKVELPPNIVKVEVVPTVNNTPVTGAYIKINNVEGNYIHAQEGTTLSYYIDKFGYNEIQKDDYIVPGKDATIYVPLSPKTVKFEIIARVDGVVVTDAVIIMDEMEQTYVEVQEGTSVSYKVSKTGYVTQEGQAPATETPLYIDLEPKILRYTINPTPSNAKVIITKNGQAYENKTITCKIGDVINYTVSADWYITKTRSSDLTIEDQDVAETVKLELLEDMLRIPPYNYRAVNITKDADDGMDNDFGGSFDYAEAKGVKKGNTATYTWYFSQSEAKTQAEKMQNIISQGTGRDYRIVARCLMGVSASSSYNITWSIGRYYCGFLVWICKSIKSAI